MGECKLGQKKGIIRGRLTNIQRIFLSIRKGVR